ncbi:unnamed protein product, partial [Closterium sp. NIES-53]
QSSSIHPNHHLPCHMPSHAPPPRLSRLFKRHTTLHHHPHLPLLRHPPQHLQISPLVLHHFHHHRAQSPGAKRKAAPESQSEQRERKLHMHPPPFRTENPVHSRDS